MGTKNSKQESPPSYEETTHIPNANPIICASATPKWRWTNAQCQEWIYAVLTELCGRNEDYAREKSQKFEGFGIELYTKGYHKWIEYLGEADGRGIYTLIVETGWVEVPKCVTLKAIHGKNWQRTRVRR
jgi:hypothetical protein